MTDRIHSITVVLDKDIREDDAEALIAAFTWFKGVASAKGNISDHRLFTAETRVRLDFQERLFGQLKD